MNRWGPNGDFLSAIRERVDHLEVRSINVDDEDWEIALELRFFKEKVLFSEESLLSELKQSHNVKRVSFLAPQLSLPV